jgi:hypothetical protein
MSMLDVIGSLPWRVGGPFKCGVYAVSAKEGSDPFVCLTKDPMVAEYLCEQHNTALKADQESR